MLFPFALFFSFHNSECAQKSLFLVFNRISKSFLDLNSLTKKKTHFSFAFQVKGYFIVLTALETYIVVLLFFVLW